MDFPCWCRRHPKLPAVHVLRDPREIAAARLEELRCRRSDDEKTPTVEVHDEYSHRNSAGPRP
jgi:hypothetical protein